MMATDGEMRALLVLAIVLLAAASAFAYSNEMTEGLSAVMSQTGDVVVTEPAMLLVSGALLLGLGGAVRRYSV